MHISKNQIKRYRSYKDESKRSIDHRFVAEGQKCVGELLKSYQAEAIIVREDLFTDQSASGSDMAFIGNSNQFVLEATAMEIEQISSLRNPQGVIGIFVLPEDNGLPIMSSDSLYLALDHVQDPGNMGTILRTADWFGVHDVLVDGCADVYNPKVVQATMGALARVRVHRVSLPSLLEQAKQEGLPIYGTLLDGTNMYAGGVERNEHGIANGVIVMGNEGNGISEYVRHCVTHPIRIPSYPENCETSESLNVSIATAITLAYFRQIANCQNNK